MSPTVTKPLAALLLVLAALPGEAAAVEQITVVGLFRDKAVVNIDGNRRVLQTGETSPEGVTLVSADSEQAVLEVDGERATYPLGARISTRFASPDERAVVTRVWRSPRGTYDANGSINGYPVDFIVDTGASLVAMSKRHARRLGIDYLVQGSRGISETASGMVDAYVVTLDRVRVGDIELRDVRAAVLDSNHPSSVLLGMSFLDRLETRREGDLMELIKK